MGRHRGDKKYTKEVNIIEKNKLWQCKHCEETYAGGFSRIKAHLDKTKGKGISQCRVYCNKEGASSSIDPQEAINTLNPSQGNKLWVENQVIKKYTKEVNIIEKNKLWQCKHCEETYAGGFSRIKAHLDKTQQGKGISQCPVYCNKEGAPSSIDPQEAINTLNPSQADQGAPGMIDTIGGSINHQTSRESSSLLRADQGAPGMIDTIGGSINHQTNRESSSLLRGSVYVNVNGGSNGHSDLSTSLRQLNESLSDLTREEDDIMGQLQCLESHGKKRKTKVDDWLHDLKMLKTKAIDMNNSLDQFGPTNFSVLEMQLLTSDMLWCKSEKPLVLSNEFVGDRFEYNVKEMWKLLGDDKVLTIGILGMGGVGKTLLATYMENEIKRKGTFKHVFWVTVSHDFSIFKLQHDIAETIGVKLYRDDERARATILSSELEKLEKTVLILDDVWKYIDLQNVGIPLKVNGIKLIITTRLKHLGRQMDCLPHNKITMRPFFRKEEEEDWDLFLLELGQHGTPATLPPQVLEIARSVVEKCDGLPLGISVMARTMKGRDDIVWWRHALHKFETFEMGQEVLTVLKRSYDHLFEKDLQNCLLHCALFPFNEYTERRDLITNLTESGVLNGKRSLREISDEAHIIVDTLVDHSLLVSAENDDLVEMHGLVKIMACHILHMMVKCNQNLIKIPHLREWTADLEAVSLANNKIEEIAKGTSPNCPLLSTLILSDNNICRIPECFFTHMSALTLLDLSNNRTITCLPNSLSKLKALTSLVLRGCKKLEYIPPLGELQALSRLDISNCSIHQAPQGLEKLINLKWLDLSRTWNSTPVTIPGGVLSNLTNMQYLDLRQCSGIKVGYLRGMTMLECFAAKFLDSDSYNHYIREIWGSSCGSETSLVHFGEINHWIHNDLISSTELQCVMFGDCEESLYLLPGNLAELSVSDNNEWVCLCSALSSNGPSSLREIQIRECTKLKSLFCLSASCSLCTNIQNLQSLILYQLKSLTAIWKEDVTGLPQSLSPSGVFSHLKRFSIRECHEIETLFTPRLVSQLQNLESIYVYSCASMKEIFGVSDGGNNDAFNITLPKLTSLELRCLPELKTVCKGILVCGSWDILKKITVCPKLEGLPKIYLA